MEIEANSGSTIIEVVAKLEKLVSSFTNNKDDLCLKGKKIATTTQAIKAEIDAKRAVIAGATFDEKLMHYKKGDVITGPSTAAYDHCVLITGYCDEDSTFEVLNSWGGTWGMGGFFKLSQKYKGIFEAWVLKESMVTDTSAKTSSEGYGYGSALEVVEAAVHRKGAFAEDVVELREAICFAGCPVLDAIETETCGEGPELISAGGDNCPRVSASVIPSAVLSLAMEHETSNNLSLMKVNEETDTPEKQLYRELLDRLLLEALCGACTAGNKPGGGAYAGPIPAGIASGFFSRLCNIAAVDGEGGVRLTGVSSNEKGQMPSVFLESVAEDSDSGFRSCAAAGVDQVLQRWSGLDEEEDRVIAFYSIGGDAVPHLKVWACRFRVGYNNWREEKDDSYSYEFEAVRVSRTGDPTVLMRSLGSRDVPISVRKWLMRLPEVPPKTPKTPETFGSGISEAEAARMREEAKAEKDEDESMLPTIEI